MVVEMDRRLRPRRRRRRNTLLTRNRMPERPEGRTSSGLLVWLVLVQAPLRLQ
jgi:hypothetical protein